MYNSLHDYSWLTLGCIETACSATAANNEHSYTGIDLLLVPCYVSAGNKPDLTMATHNEAALFYQFSGAITCQQFAGISASCLLG